MVVGYEVHGANWKLSISDTGAGMPDLRPGAKKTGLGTSLINALAQQLDAQVDIVSGGPNGTTVSLTMLSSSRACRPLPEARSARTSD